MTDHMTEHVHDGILYLGYLATVIPCLLAIPAAISGRLGRGWIVLAQRWLVGSWFLLTVGIAYGMWHAYQESGWSNQWIWDSISNGSLFPWLCEAVLLTAVAAYELHGTHDDANAGRSRLWGSCIAAGGGLLLSCALIGQLFKREADVTLTAGEVYRTVDPYQHCWQLTSNGVSNFDAPDRRVTAVLISTRRDGHPVRAIETEQRQYADRPGSAGPVTVAGILEGPDEDLYVTLTSARTGADDDAAELRIAFNPLAQWTWPGGAILAVGGLIALWPRRAPLTRPARQNGDATLNPTGAPV